MNTALNMVFIADDDRDTIIHGIAEEEIELWMERADCV